MTHFPLGRASLELLFLGRVFDRTMRWIWQTSREGKWEVWRLLNSLACHSDLAESDLRPIFTGSYSIKSRGFARDGDISRAQKMTISVSALPLKTHLGECEATNSVRRFDIYRPILLQYKKAWNHSLARFSDTCKSYFYTCNPYKGVWPCWPCKKDHTYQKAKGQFSLPTILQKNV